MRRGFLKPPKECCPTKQPTAGLHPGSNGPARLRRFLNAFLKNFSGTTIKDTWTKPRGRVEVGEAGGFSWGGMEGWGEKAYNCN